ncbi:MAG TPA: response regulator transcription factor [Verrucomicrobiae bacterium]|nr:response regulator transcription factor [Verrucomicrobiae bacterium]
MMKTGLNRKSSVGVDKYRVLLVDDHPILCEGLSQRINSESDLEVCGQVRDARDALGAIEKLQPHVAIVDIALGEGNGVELLKDMKIRFPHLPALVLSMHDEALYAERVLRAGARGYVMKQEQPEVLLRAIRQVLGGELYLSDRVKNGIVNRLGGSPRVEDASTMVGRLSDRELEVFQMIGDGFATHEIAERLHLSMKTVASHRENIKKKLRLTTGEQLARFAIHWQRYRSGREAPSLAIRPESVSDGRKSGRPRARPG